MKLHDFLWQKRVAKDIFPGAKCPAALYDHASCLSAGIARHGSEAAMNDYVTRTNAEALQVDHAKVAEAESIGGTSRIRRPRFEDSGKQWKKGPIYLASIVHMPLLSLKTDEYEWGRYCIGCRQAYTESRLAARMYTRASFVEHLEERGPLILGHHISSDWLEKVGLSRDSEKMKAVLSLPHKGMVSVLLKRMLREVGLSDLETPMDIARNSHSHYSAWLYRSLKPRNRQLSTGFRSTEHNMR